MNPCGHRTRHTAHIGCCAGCKRLFSSDSAFAKHRTHGPDGRGVCHDPETRGLVAKPSRSAPGEVLWGFAPDERSQTLARRHRVQDLRDVQAVRVPQKGPDDLRASEGVSR